MTATFTFGESDYEHRIGDKECDVGWCDVDGYPLACRDEDCPGLVHANFGDESWDSYWLFTQCDVCGEPYY